MSAPAVALAPCRSYAPEEVRRALAEVLAPLGGLDFVRPGMRVAIKSNLVTVKKPEAAATTHPALLCALVEALTARGAQVTLGDSPGGLYNSAYVNRVYAAAGVREIERFGGALNQNFAERERTLPDAAVAKTIRYTAWLDDADVIINFAKLKTHAMMGLSAAAKNFFGIIPGTLKPEYHVRFPDPMDFARMIVDLDEAFPAALCIVDGVVGMEGNGPTAGTPREVGCLIASGSPHLADLVCARIIGLSPKDVPTLVAAQERGLAPAGAEEIVTNIPVEPFCIPDYRLMPTWTHDSSALWGKGADALLRRVLASRPAVTASLCVGCGKCAGLCPAKAITIRDGKPEFNRGVCIRCFCCQEFCPRGAIHSHRTLIARIAGKL